MFSFLTDETVALWLLNIIWIAGVIGSPLMILVSYSIPSSIFTALAWSLPVVLLICSVQSIRYLKGIKVVQNHKIAKRYAVAPLLHPGIWFLFIYIIPILLFV